jgi:hypothetical protein
VNDNREAPLPSESQARILIAAEYYLARIAVCDEAGLEASADPTTAQQR